MTRHEIIVGNSGNMPFIEDGSVDLVVTSPPYPMIEMWDQTFCMQNPEIMPDLKKDAGLSAFYKMHDILNTVWRECDRVLSDNGFVCINIGDATRTINGNFQLYSNHTQVINEFLRMGYSVLPDIHWRKQSNAPNKFMGSGMYPAGAYVTYEHEYILVFRKGNKRIFKGKNKELRKKSAFFWEERNVWFSDLWEIRGASQIIPATQSGRKRSASFPFEIPYRLINMYSAEGDCVLDPFTGLGTTNLAAMAANRNSYGVEIDAGIADLALSNIKAAHNSLNSVIDTRISHHLAFISALDEDTKGQCYVNVPYGFPVKTKQETAIRLNRIQLVEFDGYSIFCQYDESE